MRLSTYQVNFRAKIKRRQYLLAPRQRRQSKPEHCLHRTRLGNCSLGWFPAFLRTGHSMSAAGGGRNQATFDLRDSFFRLTVCCDLSAELSPSLHSPLMPYPSKRCKFNSFRAENLKPIKRAQKYVLRLAVGIPYPLINFSRMLREKLCAQRPLFHRERASFDVSEQSEKSKQVHQRRTGKLLFE